jgi:hypothetical protein
MPVRGAGILCPNEIDLYTVNFKEFKPLPNPQTGILCPNEIDLYTVNFKEFNQLQNC